MPISEQGGRKLAHWTMAVGGIEMILSAAMGAFPSLFPPWMLALVAGIGLVTVGAAFTLLWPDLGERPKALLRKWIGPGLLLVGLVIIVGTGVWYLFKASPNLFEEGSVFGVVLVTAVLVVVMLALVSPRRTVPDDSRDRIEHLRTQLTGVAANQSEANVQLSGMIGRVEDKADKIALNVQADIKSVREEIRSLFERTEQQYELAGQGQMRLRKAILARDAEALLKVQDKAIVELGVRLLSGDSPIYRNADDPAKAWLADYEIWERALGEVDRIIGLWQQKHKRYLDVSRQDYERTPHMPPTSIDSNSTNVTRFKTVCIAQERYMQARSNIAEYFSEEVRGSL